MSRFLASIALLSLLLPAVVSADRASRDAQEERRFNRTEVVVQDAAQTSPIDASAVSNEGNQSSNSTSVTTTVGNDLLLSLPKWETATWSSYGTGETEDMAPTSSDMGWTAGSYKNAASTAGTETMTINISSSRDVDEVVVAVKSAGSSASSVTVTDTYTYAGTDYANPHAVTQIGNGVSTTTYAYDNNGNLIQKIASSGGSSTTTLHAWDYANRLLQTAIGNTSTTTTTYGYDAFGSRVFMGVNGATTTYPSKYFSRIFSTTGATTTATTTSYIFSGDTLLATFEGGPYASTTRYSHPDHLGSTALVTNSAGTSTLQTLEYFPYGSERINTGSQATTKTYIGLYSDDSTDLLYANARYYNPSQGQFLSQDPMFWEVGQSRIGRTILQNPQLLGSYSYAAGNPITGKDADGRLVELVSRPIGGYGGLVGGHTFLAIAPENSKTIGTIPGVDVNRNFTLSGYTHGTDLYKSAGVNLASDTDYNYAYGPSNNAVGRVVVAPPAGMSQEEFERQIVASYNAMPGTITETEYGALGQNRLFGKPNSNNVASSLLFTSGVSGSQVDRYQSQLYVQNSRFTPGLGQSAITPVQSASGRMYSTLTALKGVLTQLLKSLGGSSKK